MASTPAPTLREVPRGGAVTEDDGVLPDGTTVFNDTYPGIAGLDPDLLGALRHAARDAADDGIELFVSSGAKCLKSGGHLFVTTINQTPIALFAAIFVAEYVLQLVPKGVHQYNRFVNPEALSDLLKDCESHCLYYHRF